jgi:serine/threonine-protein kinase ATR
MLDCLDRIMAQFPEWTNSLNGYAVEAAWNLGRWDRLDELLQKPHQNTFEVSLGKMLLSMYKDDRMGFALHLKETRISLINPLAAASGESYLRSYDVISKLHILYELEAAFRLAHSETAEQDVKRLEHLSHSWKARLDVTQPSYRVREPILRLRRAALSLLR